MPLDIGGGEMSVTKEIGERYSQEVLAFRTQHGIADELDRVVELVNQAFPDAYRVTVEIEKDPESDQRWAMVDVAVQGGAREIRQRHRECVRQIVNVLSWPTSTLIRTTYTLA